MKGQEGGPCSEKGRQRHRQYCWNEGCGNDTQVTGWCMGDVDKDYHQQRECQRNRNALEINMETKRE